MADTTALKNRIRAAIKANDNQEITGPVLQQALLDMVDELNGATETEATIRSNADSALHNADTQLNNLITGIKNNIDNGYVYAGIATPSTVPVSGKVFYIATTAGTYTNFGAQVLTQGINILRYNGSAWSNQQIIGIDDEPIPGSNNFVKSGGVANKSIDDSHNLLFNSKRTQNKFYNTAYSANNSYDVFEVEVTSGETYYISPCRFISKAGVNIQGETSEITTYTADFTGILYVTFSHSVYGWVVSKMQDISGIRPFNTPSLNKLFMAQSFGLDEKRPYSQYGIHNFLKRLFNEYNLTFVSVLRENYYHQGDYAASNNHDVYEINVVNGTSYTLSPGVRFISKAGVNIGNYSGGTTQPTEYTADFTGILYVTYIKAAVCRCICETSNIEKAGIFNSAILSNESGNSKFNPISQKSILGKFIDDNSNLLFASKRRQGYYYDTGYSANDSYNVFEVEVTSGETYYISPCRFISKEGVNIQGETTDYKYAYTADFTGILYVTFNVSVPRWVVTTKNEGFDSVRPFNTPSFTKLNLLQGLGDEECLPMSQAAVKSAFTELIKTLCDNRNILFSAKRYPGYYHNGSNWQSNSGYEVFIFDVSEGETYNISHSRFLVKNGDTKIYDKKTEPYSYTADFTGRLYITFSRGIAGWVVTKEDINIINTIHPIDAPSLVLNAFMQDFGMRADRGYSQVGIMNFLKTLFLNEYNLIFSSVLHKNCYYNTYLKQNEPSYDVYEINVVNGTSYTLSPGVRFISKAGVNIGNYSGGTTQPTEYTADFTGILYVTFGKWGQFSRYVCETSNVENVGLFSILSLEQAVGENKCTPMSQWAVTQELLKAKNNPLYNKKWVACGDSFTHGDFTGLSVEDYTFQDAPYQGEMKVYPYFIGRRTGAVIVNEAMNGSTMAYINGQRNEFSTPNGRYTQIPEDANYITLYFGINDSHQNVPIGTIDDNVNTTFYGAWNIVMEYLITHHPNAKIGIIISNGCDSVDYPNAEIAIAKKWGVAYFDMNGDPRIPLVYRTNGKSDLCQTVINLRTAQYAVGGGNGHPNPACHEDESTFIEAWLKSI